MSDRPSDGTSADAVTHRTEATPAERVADPVAPAPVARRKRLPSAHHPHLRSSECGWSPWSSHPASTSSTTAVIRPRLVPGDRFALTFGESVRELLLFRSAALRDPGSGDGPGGPVQRRGPVRVGPVFLFILAIGGFMTVVFKTGALDTGIAHLAHRFKTRGALRSSC